MKGPLLLFYASWLATYEVGNAFSPLPRRNIRQRTLVCRLDGSSASATSVVPPFGEKQYWESRYQGTEVSEFSWYCSWDDMEPFVIDFAPSSSARILLPGIGTDVNLLQGMNASGFTHLYAMDYALASISFCRSRAPSNLVDRVDWQVADARDMRAYANASMDLIIDKGTLDAVFLAGGNDAEKFASLTRAVDEMHRILTNGGILWSLSGVCTEALQTCIQSRSDEWEVLVNGDLYVSSDGYTSNNMDGTLMVFCKADESTS